MNMPEATLQIYEALTEIGVKPEGARKVERAIEASVNRVQARTEKSILERVMTREDGLRLEQKLDQRIGRLEVDIEKHFRGQQRWFIATLLTVAALVVSLVFNLLPSVHLH